MEVSNNLPQNLQDALQRGLLKRIPLTFLPFVNEQLAKWDFLFPNERRSTENLLLFVDSLSPEDSTKLFRDVVHLEDEMGVRQWRFSTEEQTILNASELARSPYFQQWRQTVQAVFDAADRYAMQTGAGGVKSRNRAIVLDLPPSLPVDEAGAWRHWGGMGRRVKLQPLASGSSQTMLAGMLAGLIANRAQTGALPNSPGAFTEEAKSDFWVIDGARSLVDAYLADQRSAAPLQVVPLSYSRLDTFREKFVHEMNNIQKNLPDADSIYDHLRQVDVTPWCPAEVSADPAVREFVRSVYLSGNGAVLFCNSFVEWAASEALRRARPRFLAARFSVRSKPKPFTSVAVFENPDRVNPLPSVDDYAGSAVDSEILAAYIWLSAIRYDEYRQSTVCVCLAESLAEAYVVAPPEFTFGQATGPVATGALAESLQSWLA